MAQLYLSKQIEEWHIEQEHGKIISAIQALPEKEQMGELSSLLARAFLNRGEYSEALAQLVHIPKEAQDGLFCVRYGLALYLLHREDEALPWFEKAREKGMEKIEELPGTYYPKCVSAWIERAEAWAPRRREKNAFERERRENRNKQPQTISSFDESVLEGLWDDCAYSLKNYVGKMPRDEDFVRAEEMLGYRLPESYKALMKKHNGGILAKNFFANPLQRDWTPKAFSVESIFGIDAEKPDSLCGERDKAFWMEEWGYPNIGLPIGDTISGGHNLIFLDYSDCGPQGEPCVVEIDQESDYEITYLADHFKEFVEGLFSEEEASED